MRTLLSNYRPSVRRDGMDGFCTPKRELPMRRVAPCHGVLTTRMTPTAQAGWKSWYVSAPRATRKTQTDKRQVRAERSPRGVQNTSAAPRQPHMKKVSSFSTNSGTVSLMSNSSASSITISTVLMVRIPSRAFSSVSAARETWELEVPAL